MDAVGPSLGCAEAGEQPWELDQGVDRRGCHRQCGLHATRGAVGVHPRGAVGATHDRGDLGARHRPGAFADRGVLDSLVRLPRNPGRRADAAHRDLEHLGHGDRSGPGPDRCCTAVGFDAVLAAVIAQLPARPHQPGGVERVRGHVHLQHGRPVHGRRLGGTTGGGLPAARGQLRSGAAVRQSAHVGVLRAPPGALDPDRRGHEGRGTQHAASDRARPAVARSERRAVAVAATLGRRGPGVPIRLGSDHAPRPAPAAGCGITT